MKIIVVLMDDVTLTAKKKPKRDEVKHKLHKCWNSDCPICRRQSRYCETCKGWNSTLTSECVGRKITGLEAGLISEGHVDFKNGDWVIQDRGKDTENTSVHPESIPMSYRGVHGP